MANADIRQLEMDGSVFYPQTDINGLVNNGEFAIDDEPTVGSDNLVKSGGVYSSLSKTYQCAVTSNVVANNIVKELYIPNVSKTVIDDVYRIVVFKAFYDSGGNYYLNGVQLNTAHNGSQNILKSYSTEQEAIDDAKDCIFDVDSTHKAVVNFSKIESGRTNINCTIDYYIVHTLVIQPILYSYFNGNNIKNIDKVTYVSDNQVINGIIKEFYNPGTIVLNTDLADIRYISISKAKQSGSKYVNAINLLKDATHYFNYYYEYDTQQEAIDALPQGFVYWKNNYYIVIDWTNISVGGIVQEAASLCVERCTNIDFSPTIAKHLQHSIFDVDSVLLGQRIDNTNMAGFYTGTGGSHKYGNADAYFNSWTIPVKEDAFYVLDFTPQFDVFFYDTYPIPRNKTTSLSKAVKKNEYFSIPSGSKAMVIDVPQDTTIVGRVQGAMKNGKKILWLGTSIPAGSKYPENASMALGYDIINNSVGSSQLRFNKDAAIVAEPGAMLTATVSELETKYRQAVTDGIMTSDYLAWLKSKSFENLVLPYIADVDAVVIDHGYNDSGTFLDPQYYPDSIINDLDGQNYSITRDDEDYDKNNYIEAFCYLLKKIYEVNPKCRIIICSYYENTSGQAGDDGIVYPMYYAGGFGSRCGYHISLVHKAIVKHFNFAFMPMYDYLGWHYALVPDSEDYISDLNTEYGTSYSKIQFTTETGAGTAADSLISYLQMRCPDGVHPYSDQTGESIKQMSDVITKLLKNLV